MISRGTQHPDEWESIKMINIIIIQLSGPSPMWISLCGCVTVLAMLYVKNEVLMLTNTEIAVLK